jgi:hypothetical protein
VNLAPWQAFETVEGIATCRTTVFDLCAPIGRLREPPAVAVRFVAAAVQPGRLLDRTRAVTGPILIAKV